MDALETAKFWLRIEGGTDFQCWNWKGAKNPTGYGRLTTTEGGAMAHRVAYELIKGPIPSGQIVRHQCDNPACCNPRHLLLGNYQDNSDDMVRRRRSAEGAKNGRTKLSNAQAAYIRRNPQGLTQKKLCEMFGLASSTVSYIRSGRSWKYMR